MGNTKTILLVDDEAIIAMATQRALEDRGYDVVVAYSGEDAIERFVQRPDIDLVLMDIDLGLGMDGTAAAQRILAYRNLPIVFLTSHTEQALVDKVRGITRYGYVVKDSGDFVLNASIEMAFELFEAHVREQQHVARYQAVIDALPDLMFVMGREGSYREAYASDPGLLAVPAERIPGMNLRDTFDEEEAERHLSFYRACLESGEVQSFDYQLSIGGSPHWFEARISKINDESVLAIVRDVTESREMERQVARTGEIQQTLVDVATRCINLPAQETFRAIKEALTTIGEAIGADRSYVFDYDFGRGIATNSFEWCAPGIEEQQHKLQDVPLSNIAEGVGFHERGLAHHVPDVSTVSDPELRGLLQGQHIKSILTVPMVTPGGCIGCVGFDFVRSRHTFTQEEHDLLSVFSELLVNLREREAAEQRLRILFDSARDNILIHELEADGTPGNYIDVNPSTCETLGYNREELLSMSPLDTTDGKAAPEMRRILARVQRGESVVLEATGRHKDGTLIPFELSIHGMKIRGRDTVMAISRDVSRRKEQEQLQKLITETAPAAIYVFDHEVGRMEYINPEYQRATGYSLDELQAMGREMTAILYDSEERAKLIEGDRQLLADREGRVFESDYKVRRKDGTIAWGYTREMVLTRNADGSPRRILGIAVDITERKRAEETVAALLDEKELLLKEVHHRIKNNMTTMISLLSLQGGMAPSAEVATALTQAQSRMHSMTVLYDKLYRSSNVSEMSIGDYIPPLVREIVRTNAAGSRLRLSMEVGDYVLPVPVLAGLGMLLNELVTNAIKYAFPGNAKGTITVATIAREPGSDRGVGSGGRGRLRLVVADDGVGLPESVSLGDSAGFGLTLVSTLSAQHRFEVEVDRSQGTRFTIQLP